jgi:glycosyltransferase involved in cell wall biosynthesis
MNITVILCTCNRCLTLPKALESVAASTLPKSVDWEVLVVDNNSSDQTREVVEEFSSRHPGRFRYLFESTPGKSHALTAGVRAARGDVLAFMDDDVTVDPLWLQNLTANLRDGAWVGAGGPIMLQWCCAPPPWLPCDGRYPLAPLAPFDLGPEAGPLAEPPFGSNMAFRKEMFAKYGDFRTDLGPSPNKEVPRPNEDTEFGRRLIAGGERLRYEPSAVIFHSVPENRLRKEYFLVWRFDKGRADIRAYGIPQGAGGSVARVPLHLFRRIAVGVLRWIVAVETRRRFEYKCKVWGLAGTIVECHHLSREKGAARSMREADARIWVGNFQKQSPQK